MNDYYTSLANLQKTLSQAYLTKNTSKDKGEVKRAVETIRKIEKAIVKLDENTKKTKIFPKR